MIAEYAVILYLNDVVLIFWVLLLQMLKDSELDTRLVLIALLVFDDLQRNDLACLVVEALKCLPKATFAEEIKNFKPVVDVVLKNNLVVTIFIIVARIVKLCRSFSLNFVRLQAEEVYLFKVEQLSLFKVSQFPCLCVQLERLPHSHRVLHLNFIGAS